MCVWFQDFLRSIPGSLLCCELHEEWVDVLEEEEEEEEQVQDVKRCAPHAPRSPPRLLVQIPHAVFPPAE